MVALVEATEAATALIVRHITVIRHFQARMPHGLFVPDDASATPRTRDTQLVTEARSRFEGPDKSLQHQAQDWGSLTVKDGSCGRHDRRSHQPSNQ
jgi:hypothetical protein